MTSFTPCDHDLQHHDGGSLLPLPLPHPVHRQSISGIYSVDPRRHSGATRRRLPASLRRHPASFWGHLYLPASSSGVYSVKYPASTASTPASLRRHPASLRRHPASFWGHLYLPASLRRRLCINFRVKHPGFTLTMESRNLGSNILDFGQLALSDSFRYQGLG